MTIQPYNGSIKSPSTPPPKTYMAVYEDKDAEICIGIVDKKGVPVERGLLFYLRDGEFHRAYNFNVPDSGIKTNDGGSVLIHGMIRGGVTLALVTLILVSIGGALLFIL